MHLQQNSQSLPNFAHKTIMVPIWLILKFVLNVIYLWNAHTLSSRTIYNMLYFDSIMSISHSFSTFCNCDWNYSGSPDCHRQTRFSTTTNNRHARRIIISHNINSHRPLFNQLAIYPIESTRYFYWYLSIQSTSHFMSESAAATTIPQMVVAKLLAVSPVKHVWTEQISWQIVDCRVQHHA